MVLGLALVSALGGILPTREERMLGTRIVNFCARELGQQVGSGECADLASKALEYAGAAGQRPPDYPQPGDYVWGDLIYSVEYSNGRIVERPRSSARLKLIPGDVIQFHNVTIELSNGYKAIFGHHTSVLAKVSNKGIDWGLLEQNSLNRRYVVSDTISLSHLQSGYVLVYRPQPLNR
jgi:hypothetical protein